MKRPTVGQSLYAIIDGIEHAAEVIESKPGAITCRVQTQRGVIVRTFDKHGRGVDGAHLKPLRKPGVKVTGAVR